MNEKSLFTAVADNVVIDPSPEHETFGEGLIVTTIVSDNRSWTGRVLAVGPGVRHHKTRKLIPNNTTVGAWVAYDMRSIRDILFRGKWYHVCRDEAVFFEYEPELNENGRLRVGRPKVDAEV